MTENTNTNLPMTEQVKAETSPDALGESEPLSASQATEATDLDEHTPVSEITALHAHLQAHPRDTKSWNLLIDAAEASSDLDTIKNAYEALLQAFPNTAPAQIAYLNHYLTPGLFPLAESLFARFLRPSPSVDLWKFYLTYVRRVNTEPSTRDVVKRSYEFALAHVGQDKDASEIWRDYIDFLKAGEARTTWEEQQKMDALRRVYQRAVQIPLENVEVLWREFDAFENGLNKITAKKFLADLSPAYMTARTTLREIRTKLKDLLPLPAAPTSPTTRPPLNLPDALRLGDQADRARVVAWKNYLKWEESNPLDIEEKAVLNGRLQGIYRKSVYRMRFVPEIWYMAFVWANSVSKQDDAISFLKAGMEANPSSFLLHFAFAELHELQKNNEEAHATFDRLLSTGANELERLTPTQEVHSDENSKQQVPDDNRRRDEELIHLRKLRSMVWIVYMRFARRAEGTQSARNVFGRARKDPWTSWEIYDAAALMEYHCTKDTPLAVRIFEAGMKKFSNDVDYVSRYLGFLISVNDDSNARALFERVISLFGDLPDRAWPIWRRWSKYEYWYGDLAAAQKLEKRISESYPSDAPIKRFAERHQYLDFDPIATHDLGFRLSSVSTNSSITISPAGSGTALGGMAAASAAGGGSSGQYNTSNVPLATFNKRAPSPSSGGTKRRPDENGTGGSGPPPKRLRGSPPPPPPRRDRERDIPPPRDSYREPPPSRWESGRRWGGVADSTRSTPPPRRGGDDRDHHGNSSVGIPPLLSLFLGTLPSAGAFDGPRFDTDELMALVKSASIPGGQAMSSGAPHARSRSPVRTGGRPPPDYGPYQGPPGRGRRY